MKHFLLGVATTLLVLAIGGLLYLKLGLAEVRADLPPSRWESSLMTSAAHASVRRRAPEIPNPVAPTEENLIAGGKLYLNECAGCHGTLGKPNESREALYPPIPGSSGGRHAVLRGTNFLDRQARHPPLRYVRERQMGFR